MNPKIFFGELKRRNVYKQRNFFAGRGLRDDARYKNLLAKVGLPTTQ
jgi:hypothetical protein